MLQPSLRGKRPTAPTPRRESERGQMLVLFALALVGLIGMVGLVIDGGDTSLQRRDQQNVADAAAMAAGYASLNGQDPTAAAQSVASANGYTNGANDTTVTLGINVGETEFTADVTRPHQNYFSGILGFASWNVSATATVQAGIPNAATGMMPIIVNQDAWAANLDPNNPGSFDEPPSGNEDIPVGTSQFNWTVFCATSSSTCNADSNVVEDWIVEDGISAVVTTDWVIAPLNAGAHTTLFDAFADVVGEAFPIAVVDNDGTLLGWAYFHLTGSVGGSTKQISGWFEDGFTAPTLGIINGHGSAGFFGSYVIELIN